MLKLVIEDDEGKQTVVPLIRDEITIGRKEGNTIRLTERNVSRRHCRLVKQNGAVFVEDLQSYNGVKMNGVRIAARTPIAEGDTVAVGDYKLLVRYDRPAVVPGAAVAPAPSPKATALGIPPTGATGSQSEFPTSPGLPRIDPSGASGLPPPVAPAAAIPSPFPAATTPAPVLVPAPAPAPAFVAPVAVSPPVMPPLAVPPAGIPAAALEGLPTMPLRTLADQAAAMAAPPVVAAVPPARLVVVSTELGGMEFLLNRPSAVIGRTEENDVMLNHRSISRHHAKIVRDGDRYTIVDLQSANGVRVNGESYERIELHPGDVIELGHVRMRFVGPGEKFTFDTLAPGAFGRKRNLKPFAFIGGGAVVAVILGAIFMTGDGVKPKSKTIEVASGESPKPKTEPSVEPTKAIEPTVTPTGPTESAAELVAKAEDAAKREKWDDAVGFADRALGKDPGEERARDLKQRYQAERKNADLYAKFKQANDDKNYDDAMFAYSEITEDSFYKDKGRSSYQAARKQFVAKHLDLAEKLRAQGKCTDVESESKLVLTVDEKNKAAREVVRLCRPKGEKPVVVADAAPPAEKAPREKPARPPREHAAKSAKETSTPKTAVASSSGSAKPAPPAEAGDPKLLVDAGRQAWVRGQYAAAIDSARKALKLKPGYTDAYLIIAVASCSLRDGDGATRAYGKLDDKMKGMVRSSCQKNGITLE